MKIKLFPLLLIASLAGATEPVISSLLPRGGQAGSTQEIVITGQRLSDSEEIFFYTDGISAENIVVEKGKKLTASFTIANEAKIGQHELRLRTKQGVSRLFTFWVGPYPNVDENEPNSSFEEAQPIPMNVTVNGVAQNEDVDYFEINATQGQRISAEIEAIRLSGPLFDPYVAILDENRFEIATSDDSELLLQDSTTSVIAPKRVSILLKFANHPIVATVPIAIVRISVPSRVHSWLFPPVDKQVNLSNSPSLVILRDRLKKR
jgi:hypothetical protein